MQSVLTQQKYVKALKGEISRNLSHAEKIKMIDKGKSVFFFFVVKDILRDVKGSDDNNYVAKVGVILHDDNNYVGKVGVILHDQVFDL